MRWRRDRSRLIGEIVFRHPARCEAASPQSITPTGHGKLAWRAMHPVLRGDRAAESEEWRGSNLFRHI